MRRHTDQSLITTALRDLDPGSRDDMTAAERERAEAEFVRIVATSPDQNARVEPSRPHRRRRRLLVPLALAGAAGIAIPVLQLGGGSSAYASWTPTPTPLTGEAAAAAADSCRAALPMSPPGVAVAERRGEWTYVLLAGQGTEAICLMPNDAIGNDPRGSDGFFGSYDPDAPAPPTLAADRIVEKTSAQGSTDEGWFNWLEGYVGSEVVGVTVHTSSGLDIQATVVGNRYAAWWPGRAQSSDYPAGETWTYTVQLADGSTRRTVCGQSTQPC